MLHDSSRLDRPLGGAARACVCRARPDRRRAPPFGASARSAPAHGTDGAPGSAAAAVRTGADLEVVPGGVGEVHAAPAVVMVDLAGALRSGIGPVRQLPLADPAEDLVELGLA